MANVKIKTRAVGCRSRNYPMLNILSLPKFYLKSIDVTGSDRLDNDLPRVLFTISQYTNIFIDLFVKPGPG